MYKEVQKTELLDQIREPLYIVKQRENLTNMLEILKESKKILLRDSESQPSVQEIEPKN